MDDLSDDQEQFQLDQFKIKKELVPYRNFTYIYLVERNNVKYVMKKISKSGINVMKD